MIWFHEIFSQFVTEPLTNGNHIEQEEGESNPIDLFKEHLATKPKSPADPGMWPRNIYQEVTQPFTYFCLLTEPTTIPNESKSRKNSASSSSRAKSGSSRPHTGYGKNRTSTDEQVNDSGKMTSEQFSKSLATLHLFLITEPSVMKSEDTNGETIGAKSDLKSARPRTGISPTLHYAAETFKMWN